MPALCTDSRARATAGRPGQVGAKIPVRSGYFVVNATVASKAFCSLSYPYTSSTISMSLYFLISSRNAAIQAF